MPRLSDDVVADAYTSEFAWNLLEDLTGIGNRMAGQIGEEHGAAVLADAFERAGLREVETVEFDVPGWWRDSTSITTSGRWTRTFDDGTAIIALPGSPSGRVTGELVDVGYGLPSEFETAGELSGRIVLARAGGPDDYDRWVHRNEKYATAMEHGASAFLFQNDTPGCLPVTGSVNFGDATVDAEIPAAGISYELGHRLRTLTDDGLVPTTLSVECRNEPSTSRNVHGVVGPDTDEEVIVGAHYDSHDIAEGAGDNGAGTSIVAEIGRLLARDEDELETRVRLVGFGAEEIGMLGAYHLVDRTDRASIKAAVNNDGIGEGRTLTLNYSTFEEFVEPFERAADALNTPIHVESHVHPHGDKWPFVQDGIASCSVSSGGDGRFTHAHTHADTLDKIDKRDLRALAVTEAAAILELASEGFEVSHRPKAAIRGAMHEDYERGLKLEGRWPFDE